MKKPQRKNPAKSRKRSGAANPKGAARNSASVHEDEKDPAPFSVFTRLVGKIRVRDPYSNDPWPNIP